MSENMTPGGATLRPRPLKVLLLFPPAWTPTMPHLATPSLTAYLRAHGVEVVQRDLNLECMDLLLTREHLEGAMRQVRRLFGGRASRRHGREQPPREFVDWALAQGPRFAREVEEAKAVLRSPAFYDPARSRAAMECISSALQIISLPFFPTSVELSSLTSAIREDVSAEVIRGAADPQTNPYHRLLDRHVIDSLVAEAPDLVGISVPTMGQFLAALTVATLLRQRGVRAHITLGGPHISMLREEMLHTPEVFDLVDSAVVFGGEAPLLGLARALERGIALDTVPNLLYRHEGQVRATDTEPPVPLAELPLPDFDGLPLERYLVPEPVLPLVTARGCYHGRCAFCNVGYGARERFEQLPAERVVERMLALRERYGVRHIFFADEAITPRNLRGMSTALAEAGAPLHWVTCARMERVLDRDLLETMARGGCRMLLYGLETAAPRIVEAMHKGTTVEEMSRVLREGTAAGLWNHVFFFFGFPGETMEDAQATVDFIYAHGDSIHSAALGTFLLERYAPAHLSPEAFGIRQVAPTAERDLAIYFDYQVQSGIDEAMAETIVERLMGVLPIKETPQYYMHDTYRFLYASRLADEGRPFPAWLGKAGRLQ